MSAAAKALPVCLTRRSEDDREQAENEASRRSINTIGGLSIEARDDVRNAELAKIQRVEAEMVYAAAPLAAGLYPSTISKSYALSEGRFELWQAGERAARIALLWCAEPTTLTLDQRGRLLDAARELVALAIEVSHAD